MELALSIIATIFVVVGFLGIALPGLPDLPLMLLGLFLRSVATDFTHPTLTELAIAGTASAMVLALELFAAPFVAKKFGASKQGQWGALIGSLLSFLFIPFSPWFILVLPLIGTVIGELNSGRTRQAALKSSLGTALGVGGLLVIKTIVAFGLLGTLIVSFFRG